MTDQPGMNWKPRHVSIVGDGVMARVLLDDADISNHVQSYAIEHRAGESPVVVFQVRPTGGATFDGMARVAVGQQADPGEVIAAFLGSINPAALDQAALGRDDLDGERGELTRAMLKQLAEWAQGTI